MEDRPTLTHAELASRIHAAARLTRAFTLRSGRTATEYFDKYRFEADPVLLDDIAEQLAPLLPTGTEMLAGLEMGGIPVVTALGRHTGLPCAFVPSRPRKTAPSGLPRGIGRGGRRVLVIEDVVTSGGQVVLSTAELRKLGATVDSVLCVVDREQGGAQALAEAVLALRSLFTAEDLRRTG